MASNLISCFFRSITNAYLFMASGILWFLLSKIKVLKQYFFSITSKIDVGQTEAFHSTINKQ